MGLILCIFQGLGQERNQVRVELLGNLSIFIPEECIRFFLRDSNQ